MDRIQLLHHFETLAETPEVIGKLRKLVSPTFYDAMRGDMSGVAITRVTLEKIGRALIPLPPVAEQRRIVAKVDELLALCDELEARQAAAREQRTRLVRSALDHLSVTTMPGGFRRHAIFFVKQFPRLTATVDLIPLLRAGMIEMGVTGALTGGASE